MWAAAIVAAGIGADRLYGERIGIVGRGVAAERVRGAEQGLVEEAAGLEGGAFTVCGQLGPTLGAPDGEVGFGESDVAEHVAEKGDDIVGIAPQHIYGDDGLLDVGLSIDDDAAVVEEMGEGGRIHG